MVHEDHQYKSLIVVNPEAFKFEYPNSTIGSVFELIPILENSNHSTAQKLLIQLTPLDNDILTKQPQLQVKSK